MTAEFISEEPVYCGSAAEFFKKIYKSDEKYRAEAKGFVTTINKLRAALTEKFGNGSLCREEDNISEDWHEIERILDEEKKVYKLIDEAELNVKKRSDTAAKYRAKMAYAREIITFVNALGPEDINCDTVVKIGEKVKGLIEKVEPEKKARVRFTLREIIYFSILISVVIFLKALVKISEILGIDPSSYINLRAFLLLAVLLFPDEKKDR